MPPHNKNVPTLGTGTPGTSGGKSTVTVDVDQTATSYRVFGDTTKAATLAMARRMVEEGFDPSTPLAADGVSLLRIDQAV
jgi:hypothetical protein